MTMSEMLPLVLGVMALLILALRAKSSNRLFPAVHHPRRYACPEMVVKSDLAVTYRDAPLAPCDQVIRVWVKGDCTPICPKHHVAMVQKHPL